MFQLVEYNIYSFGNQTLFPHGIPTFMYKSFDLCIKNIEICNQWHARCPGAILLFYGDVEGIRRVFLLDSIRELIVYFDT